MHHHQEVFGPTLLLLCAVWLRVNHLPSTPPKHTTSNTNDLKVQRQFSLKCDTVTASRRGAETGLATTEVRATDVAGLVVRSATGAHSGCGDGGDRHGRGLCSDIPGQLCLYRMEPTYYGNRCNASEGGAGGGDDAEAAAGRGQNAGGILFKGSGHGDIPLLDRLRAARVENCGGGGDSEGEDAGEQC